MMKTDENGRILSSPLCFLIPLAVFIGSKGGISLLSTSYFSLRQQLVLLRWDASVIDLASQGAAYSADES